MTPLNPIESTLEYTSGNRQFEGFVKFSAPLNDESLMQIFGNTTRATKIMIRGYSASNGSIRATGDIVDADMSTYCYGVEKRINVIHAYGNYIQVYRDGSLKGSGTDPVNTVVNYHKFGCYGTVYDGTTTPAVVYWRAVKHFKK